MSKNLSKLPTVVWIDNDIGRDPRLVKQCLELMFEGVEQTFEVKIFENTDEVLWVMTYVPPVDNLV